MLISLYRHIVPAQLRLRNIEYVICDLDGTSLRNDSSLSETFLQSIGRLNDRNIKIMFASGRSESFMQPYYEQCNLHTPIISLNGSLIRLGDGSVLYSALLTSASVNKTINTVARFPDLSLVLFTTDAAYSTTAPFHLPSYLRQSNIDDETLYTASSYRYEHVSDLSSFVDSTVLAVVKGPFMAIQTLSAALARHFFDHLEKIVFPANSADNSFYMEIKRKHSNKGSAVRALSKAMKISRRRYAAIGDYFNDFEMCKAVGFCGAMCNAETGLKKISDFVTVNTNNDDGIIEFFNHIMKNRTL